MTTKLSIAALREQFDNDVERFSNEQTGQTAIMDAPLILDMFEDGVSAIYPLPERILDIGCGAGNFSLRIARRIPQVKLTLLDLSGKMLERAEQRLKAENFIVEKTIQADIAEAVLPIDTFDAAVASMSLHHLRKKSDWENVFANIYNSLTTGGSFWMNDLIRHENTMLEQLMKQRWADYLVSLKGKESYIGGKEKLWGEEYQKAVFDNVEQCDTPETLQFICRALHQAAGFRTIDILHKNSVFAALVAIK